MLFSLFMLDFQTNFQFREESPHLIYRFTGEVLVYEMGDDREFPAILLEGIGNLDERVCILGYVNPDLQRLIRAKKEIALVTIGTGVVRENLDSYEAVLGYCEPIDPENLKSLRDKLLFGQEIRPGTNPDGSKLQPEFPDVFSPKNFDFRYKRAVNQVFLEYCFKVEQIPTTIHHKPTEEEQSQPTIERTAP